MLIYGHRGAAGEASENTLLGFRRALEVGVDGVEFDVRATADGVPVVLHDRLLRRTTGHTGAVDAWTLADLRRDSSDRDRAVPTLEETLTLLAGRARLDVELKQTGIELEVLRLLERFPTAEWVISSFDWDALRAVRRLDRRATLWPLSIVADDALFAVSAELSATTVALHASAWSGDVPSRCAAAGLAAMVWTVNDADEARRVRSLGAAALCTDLPSEMRRGLADPASPKP